MKWAQTKGGTYGSTSAATVVSLSYTPLFTGSTIYYAAWINGMTSHQGVNYYVNALKNGVDVSSWVYFKGHGPPEHYLQYMAATKMITTFANPASGTAISLSVTVAAYPDFPFYNGHTGILAWEIVG